MSTTLDQNYVKAVRESFDKTSADVATQKIHFNAMVSEVERLETIAKNVEKKLDSLIEVLPPNQNEYVDDAIKQLQKAVQGFL